MWHNFFPTSCAIKAHPRHSSVCFLYSKLHTELQSAISCTFMILTAPTHLQVFNQLAQAMLTHSI